MVVIVVALDDWMMSVTRAPQKAPDNGVAAALLSAARSPEPASALRPAVITLMPSRNRPTPPRTEIVVDMHGPPGCNDSQVSQRHEAEACSPPDAMSRAPALRVLSPAPSSSPRRPSGTSGPAAPPLRRWQRRQPGA